MMETYINLSRDQVGHCLKSFHTMCHLLGIQMVFLFSKVLSSLYGHFNKPLMSYHIRKAFKRITCYFVVFDLENLSQI